MDSNGKKPQISHGKKYNFHIIVSVWELRGNKKVSTRNIQIIIISLESLVYIHAYKVYNIYMRSITVDNL